VRGPRPRHDLQRLADLMYRYRTLSQRFDVAPLLDGAG
jgi:hypothetical protein